MQNLFRYPEVSPQSEVCLITMVRDEEFYLPIYVEHYLREFKNPQFIIIDHSSKKAVKNWLPEKYPNALINVIDLPDIPFDDAFKSVTISSIASIYSLCCEYVIASDVDELVVSLTDQSISEIVKLGGRFIAPIGMEIVHRPALEKEYDHGVSLLAQRNAMYFQSGYTKPIVWKQPAAFSVGLHWINNEYEINDKLGLCHLRFVDQNNALERKRKRAKLDFSEEQVRKGRGKHWVAEESRWLGSWIFKKADSNAYDKSACESLNEFLSKILPVEKKGDFFKHPINISGDFLLFDEVKSLKSK